MRVGPKLEARILAELGVRSRGKQPPFAYVRESAPIEPRIIHDSGYTRWKGGRPRKYFRAPTEVEVHPDWLRQHYPVSCTLALLSGSSVVEYDWRDGWQQPPIWWQGGASLNEEEDRLYAD